MAPILPSHPGIPFPYILGWAGGTDFLIAAIGLEQPFAGGKGVVCPGVLLTFGTLLPSVKTVTYKKWIPSHSLNLLSEIDCTAFLSIFLKWVVASCIILAALASGRETEKLRKNGNGIKKILNILTVKESGKRFVETEKKKLNKKKTRKKWENHRWKVNVHTMSAQSQNRFFETYARKKRTPRVRFSTFIHISLVWGAIWIRKRFRKDRRLSQIHHQNSTHRTEN